MRTCLEGDMTNTGRAALQGVADRLRALAMAKPEGALLGSEDVIVTALGASRTTVRQAARLLEREGVVCVRRGPSGGYFSSRPGVDVMQQTLGTYLQALEFDAEEITIIASALWVELVRKAARHATDKAEEVLAPLVRQIAAIKPSATFGDIRELESRSREAVFSLAESRYIELIFKSNIIFANRAFAPPAQQDHTPEHRDFVIAWRDGKLVELSAIRRRDEELATVSARYIRKVWHDRVWLNRNE